MRLINIVNNNKNNHNNNNWNIVESGVKHHKPTVPPKIVFLFSANSLSKYKKELANNLFASVEIKMHHSYLRPRYSQETRNL